MSAIASNRLARVLTAVAAAALTLVGGALLPSTGAASAAPAELDFGRYTPVNPNTFRSLAYVDDGRHFFRAGSFRCQLGPNPGEVACQGKPATAPPHTTGVAIVASQSGPWWVPPNTTFRWGSRAGFRTPVLHVGERVTVGNVACARPRSGVVSCASPNRAFIIARGWHKFYYPKGATDHSKNPPARYLPKSLR
ncbi:hypothetical protein [Gordonia sp. VNK21]|uniref:hypothetical protein n=1 Tax=Gordonia sp. VNK21 TaxID=3382483 RepID=UPI0038D508AA